MSARLIVIRQWRRVTARVIGAIQPVALVRAVGELHLDPAATPCVLARREDEQGRVAAVPDRHRADVAGAAGVRVRAGVHRGGERHARPGDALGGAVDLGGGRRRRRGGADERRRDEDRAAALSR